MKEFVINKNDSGQRLDKFIGKAVPKLPQSLMHKYLRTKRIKLNGKRCEASYRLAEGDILSMYVNDEFFDAESSAEKYDFMKAKSGIVTVYEDENIILINKPAGLVVHEDDEGTADTLINRLKKYLYEKGEYIPENEQSFAPALCNRLDRNTQGIVIAAKTAESLRILNAAIKNRDIDKHYLCICIGRPPKDSDILTDYLFKDSSLNKVIVSDRKTPENRTAVTEYKVLRSDGKLSLLEIKLHTGRTHQIRAQLAHIGCPLLGDGKYGINRINREYKIYVQALCAYKLIFSEKADFGCLDYLSGKEFSVGKADFEEKFL